MSQTQVDPRIPQDRRAWVIKYRVGSVENVFGDFNCDVPDCECQFLNLADFLLHWCYGRHGALGDKDAEMKRLTNKYYSKQERMKERIYRQQQKESDDEGFDPGDLEIDTEVVEVKQDKL